MPRVTQGISFEPDVLETAKQQAGSAQRNLSNYIQSLIIKDGQSLNTPSCDMVLPPTVKGKPGSNRASVDAANKEGN